jgi:hypothetical protein
VAKRGRQKEKVVANDQSQDRVQGVKRQAGGRVRISKSRSLSYHRHRENFVHLGRSCGYRNIEAVPPEERRQIMGNRGDVYERYYIPNFIARDTLAIYLGTTPRDDLIKSVGHLERHEGALDRLTDAQKRDIWNDPEIVSLVRRREGYAAKIQQRGYATIKAAEGTRYFTLHTEVQREINCLKSLR